MSRPRCRTARSASGILFATIVLVAGCGDSDSADGADGTGGTGLDSAGPSGGASADGGGGAALGGAGVGGNTGSGGAGTGGGAGLPDPEQPGPYQTSELDAVANVASTGHAMPVHVEMPTSGPQTGPYPVVVIGHGFQIPISQYEVYAEHLASFGYVAIAADFPASAAMPDHVAAALDLRGALDWASTAPELAGIADSDNAGMTGHSLGGKVALLAATEDPRIQAVVALDPVDGSMGCSPQACPDVSALMPLPIPTALLGETTDATGAFQACAPAAENYKTFYAGTTSPSIEVTLLGANHMSFVQDLAACGIICSFCNASSVDNATVNTIARSYLAAFFERYIRGNSAYDDYLDGVLAQKRYVDTGLATIASK